MRKGSPEGREVPQPEAVTYIYLIRHSNRFAGKNEIKMPDGSVVTVTDPEDLTPEGKARAEQFGAELPEVDLVHTRASVEGRAKETAAIIKKGSGKFGPTRERIAREKGIAPEPGPVSKGRGIAYSDSGISSAVLKEAKKLIAAELPADFSQMSPGERAKRREPAQAKGLEYAMQDEDSVEKAAEALAAELVFDRKLSQRGVKLGTKVAIPVVSHGMFNESLFKKALVVEDPKTGDKKVGFDHVGEIGGFSKQAEGMMVKITRKADGSEELEYAFTDPERAKLFEGKRVYLDWNIVENLARKFRQRMREEDVKKQEQK